MEEEIKQLKQRIQELEEQLGGFNKIGRFTFYKLLQILDGRNIQTGKTTGTKIGTETTQKIGFYNTTPVDQPDTVSDPTAAGATYVQATAQSSVDAIKAIIDRLQELGLIA